MVAAFAVIGFAFWDRRTALQPALLRAMKPLAKGIVGGAVGVALLTGTAWGIDIETITVTTSVEERLTLLQGTAAVSFGGIDPQQGVATLPRSLTFHVTSNRNWTLTVMAGDDLRNLQSPGDLIPIERLRLRRTGEGGFQPLSKTVERVVAEGGRTPAQGVEISFDLQLAVQWEDPPGTYQTTLRFILRSHP